MNSSSMHSFHRDRLQEKRGGGVIAADMNVDREMDMDDGDHANGEDVDYEEGADQSDDQDHPSDQDAYLRKWVK